MDLLRRKPNKNFVPSSCQYSALYLTQGKHGVFRDSRASVCTNEHCDCCNSSLSFMTSVGNFIALSESGIEIMEFAQSNLY